MVLFTHLKIILLQCFLIFNFQFQFSVVSKPTLKLHSACLDSAFSAESRVAFFHFFFFFSSPHFMRFALGQGTTSTIAVLFMYYNRGQLALQQYCLCTITVLFTYLKILKMSHTILFTHLKIILLQCFQFSVSVTISSIQMDPQ